MERDGRSSINRRSVWDRLLAPARRTSRLMAAPTQGEIEESIRCDLEDLFRTRSAWGDYLDSIAALESGSMLESSILNYGLPDFSNIHFGPDQLTGELKRAIEDALDRYEPRLIEPEVEVKEVSEKTRTVTFSITATIRIGATGHDVRYRTEIDFDGRVEVQKVGT